MEKTKKTAENKGKYRTGLCKILLAKSQKENECKRNQLLWQFKMKIVKVGAKNVLIQNIAEC